MCLLIDGVAEVPAPKIAAKDIVCYKVLVKTKRGYQTPYLDKKVGADILNGTKPFIPNRYRRGKKPTRYDENGIPNRYRRGKKPTRHDENNYSYSVDEGWIHVFENKQDATREALDWEDGATFECVIPEGTPYYEGVDAFLRNCYAAAKIMFKPIP